MREWNMVYFDVYGLKKSVTMGEIRRKSRGNL